MSPVHLSLNRIYFRYPATPDPIFEELSLEISSGWTGVSGENGAGKTTLLELAAGILIPDQGIIRKPASSCICLQRTDLQPVELGEFLYSGDPEAMRLMSLLSMDWDWYSRWNSLSQGERKRAQIATALWLSPELLALDEPTNHLDTQAKDLLVQALKAYEGIGLIVSHDREVLDTLCGSCVFIHGGKVVKRPGGISDGLREEEREKKEARHAYEKAVHQRERLRGEADSRRRLAESSRNRISGRNLKPGDSDGRGRLNRARVTGKDAVGGKLYAQMQSRLKKADELAEKTSTGGIRKTGFRMSGEQARSDFLFRIEGCMLTLGNGRNLTVPPLSIVPTARIALTGANGTGKTTLIRYIRESIGTGRKILYIPQELDAGSGAVLLRSLEELDQASRGEVLARFSRLGSDPEKLAVSRNPSPGETRKLLFANGVFSSPELIIMDEPTNHLDLPSIILLENALREVNCAFLLVSHDRVFIRNLTETEWRITADGSGNSSLEIRQNTTLQ